MDINSPDTPFTVIVSMDSDLCPHRIHTKALCKRGGIDKVHPCTPALCPHPSPETKRLLKENAPEKAAKQAEQKSMAKVVRDIYTHEFTKRIDTPNTPSKGECIKCNIELARHQTDNPNEYTEEYYRGLIQWAINERHGFSLSSCLSAFTMNKYDAYVKGLAAGKVAVHDKRKYQVDEYCPPYE